MTAATFSDAVSPAKLPEKTRNFEVDAYRFLAAVGVAWIHATNFVVVDRVGRPDFLGRFAVPFFASVAMYFGILGLVKKRPAFGAYAAGRFVRLYLPFIVWSVVYLIVKAKLEHRPEPIGLRRLWDGGSYHMWFLPFLLIFSVLIFPIGSLLARRPSVAGTVAFICVAVALPMSIWNDWLKSPLWMPISIAEFFAHCIESAPSALCGVALAAIALSPRKRLLQSTLIARIALAISVAAIIGSGFGWQNLLFTISGVALAIAGLAQTGFVGWKWLAPLGRLSFGIYLAHLIFIGAFRKFANSHGLPDTTIAYAIANTLFSVAAAAVVTWLILKVKPLRWLVI